MTLDEYYPNVKNSFRGKKFEVIGDVVDYRTKVDIRCVDCSAETSCTPANLFFGQIPCKCGLGYYKTDERRMERLLEVTYGTNLLVDYSLVKVVKNSKQRIYLSCADCGYCWNASYSSVVRKTTGCSRCSNVTRYTEQEYIDKINLLSKICYISKTTENIGRSTKVIVECKACNNQFSAAVGNLLQNRGCPKCAAYGYNTKESGYLYILSLKMNNNVVGYKFGITNNPIDRIDRLTKKSKLEVSPVFIFNFENGTDAFNLETKIKKIYGNGISKQLIPDGFTETVKASDIKSLLSYINSETKEVRH